LFAFLLAWNTALVHFQAHTDPFCFDVGKDGKKEEEGMGEKRRKEKVMRAGASDFPRPPHSLPTSFFFLSRIRAPTSQVTHDDLFFFHTCREREHAIHTIHVYVPVAFLCVDRSLSHAFFFLSRLVSLLIAFRSWGTLPLALFLSRLVFPRLLSVSE
jgi:hypothetical protein